MGGRKVSATEARVRFGEVMRMAVEGSEPVFVERGGKPMVVVLSMESYERLAAAGAHATRADALERLAALRKGIARRRKGKPLPDVVELIRRERGDRDEQLLDNLS